MLWSAVTWIHQRLCFDFHFKGHPNRVMRREAEVRNEKGRIVTPRKVFTECLNCGHQSEGIAIGKADGEFLTLNREFIRTRQTWVKPKELQKFKRQTFVEFRFN